MAPSARYQHGTSPIPYRPSTLWTHWGFQPGAPIAHKTPSLLMISRQSCTSLRTHLPPSGRTVNPRVTSPYTRPDWSFSQPRPVRAEPRRVRVTTGWLGPSKDRAFPPSKALHKSNASSFPRTPPVSGTKIQRARETKCRQVPSATTRGEDT
jgi:hypothetical protein